MGLAVSLYRARYYRRSLGTRQAARLYGGRLTRRAAIELRFPGIAHPVVCRPREPDRFTICHILVEGDFHLPIPLSPSLIVDAGANVGYASVYFAHRFPDAEIVALEPDVDNLAVARRNCAPYPQVRLLHAGVWSHDTRLRIVDPNVQSWAIQVQEASEDESGTLQGLSIPTLLDRLGRDRIDILKVDIEGSEEQLFASPERRAWLPRVDVVLVETHGQQAEQAVADAMDEASFLLVQHDRRRPDIYVNPRLRGRASANASFSV